MATLVERLQEDGATLALEAAAALESDAKVIAALREALCTAMRQWKFYSEMVERVDDFDLAEEKSPEGDLYRRCKGTYEQEAGKSK